MTESLKDRADRLTRIAEHATYGQRAGARMADHEVYQGHDFPRQDDAVRSLGVQNVLGADAECRDAYVNAFLDGYRARWTYHYRRSAAR